MHTYTKQVTTDFKAWCLRAGELAACYRTRQSTYVCCILFLRLVSTVDAKQYNKHNAASDTKSILRNEVNGMALKQLIKTLIPKAALRTIQKYRTKQSQEKYYRGLTTQQVFTKIYEESAWGRSDDPSQTFFSGNGSHDTSIVTTYIQAIQTFLGSFNRKPDVVDLGCGDFFIGSHVRNLCEGYTACDIVPDLIVFNKEKYKELDVDFRVLDLTEDQLPKGDVVFIRQVLQHLSNNHIKRSLPKISTNYKFLVLTEHLPRHRNFEPNLDKPAGADIRLRVKSGVVLTAPPFNLKVIDERVLCEVPEYGGVIRTTVYTLP